METLKEAVIVVDYQNDFANQGWVNGFTKSESGSLYVKGWEKLLPYINNLMKEVKGRSGLVITTQDWHPINHTSFAVNHYIKPYTQKDKEMKWPIHCLQDETWSELLNGLNDSAIDEQIYKGYDPQKECYSGFWWNRLKFGKVNDWLRSSENKKKIWEIGDTLKEVLENYNIDTLHIVWLATDYCIKDTAIDGSKNGFNVKLHEKGIAAVNATPWDGEKAIAEMKKNWVEVIS